MKRKEFLAILTSVLFVTKTTAEDTKEYRYVTARSEKYEEATIKDTWITTLDGNAIYTPVKKESYYYLKGIYGKNDCMIMLFKGRKYWIKIWELKLVS